MYPPLTALPPPAKPAAGEPLAPSLAKFTKLSRNGTIHPVPPVSGKLSAVRFLQSNDSINSLRHLQGIYSRKQQQRISYGRAHFRRLLSTGPLHTGYSPGG